MHLSRIVQLSSPPLWLLLTVIVLTGFLWLIFVRTFPLNDIAWKRVDYVWLTIALLGVLASSGRASHEFTKKSAKPKAETSKTAEAQSELKLPLPTPVAPADAQSESKIETRTSSPLPVQTNSHETTD